MTTYRLAEEVTAPDSVLELYLACKALEANSGGDWPGADLVTAVAGWLKRYGLDDEAPITEYFVPTAPGEQPVLIRAQANADLLTALEYAEEIDTNPNAYDPGW